MSLDYIRSYYDVPAYEGTEITYTWPPNQPQTGTIVGADGQYLLVSMPSMSASYIRMHPTWNVIYPKEGGA